MLQENSPPRFSLHHIDQVSTRSFHSALPVTVCGGEHRFPFWGPQSGGKFAIGYGPQRIEHLHRRTSAEVMDHISLGEEWGGGKTQKSVRNNIIVPTSLYTYL